MPRYCPSAPLTLASPCTQSHLRQLQVLVALIWAGAPGGTYGTRVREIQLGHKRTGGPGPSVTKLGAYGYTII